MDKGFVALLLLLLLPIGLISLAQSNDQEQIWRPPSWVWGSGYTPSDFYGPWGYGYDPFYYYSHPGKTYYPYIDPFTYYNHPGKTFHPYRFSNYYYPYDIWYPYGYYSNYWWNW